MYVGARQTGAPLTYWSHDGVELACVHPVAEDDLSPIVDFIKDEVVRELCEAWNVTDEHGVVFSLRRYEAADHPSYDVVVDDDRSVGTFFYEGGLVHERVIVRDDASAPVAEIETHDHIHALNERHGSHLARCRRTFDPPGNDVGDEVWSVDIERAPDSLDRRVLVAAPLVCHLIGRPKRHFDPDSAIATSLLIAVPPVGGVLIVAERAMDGLYWLRRKFD